MKKTPKEKAKPIKKLSLEKETIKELSDEELKNVDGGTLYYYKLYSTVRQSASALSGSLPQSGAGGSISAGETLGCRL